eukprot:gene19591-12674_t
MTRLWFLVFLSGTLAAVEDNNVIARVHFASCNKPHVPTPLWDIMNDRSGNLLILGGDVRITPCPLKEAHCPPLGWEQATPEKLRRLYADQDNVASFAALRAQLDSQQPSLVSVAGGAAGDGGDGGGGEGRGDPLLPVPPSIIGTWDDHDFGLNDGDGRLSIKEESAVPGGGVYTSTTYDFTTVEMRAQGKTFVLTVILLDTRYHKTAYEPAATGDFLGATQWGWLEQVLDGSTADAHLIVSSLQVLPAMGLPGKDGEHWSRFPAARQRLLQLLEDKEVAAPLLLSGDVHLGEFSLAACGNGNGDSAKKMVEVTSSGITHSWSQLPLPMRTLMRLYRQVVPQPYGGDKYYTLNRNFAEIDFTSDGTVTVRIVAIEPDVLDTGDGVAAASATRWTDVATETPLEMTWNLSELTVGTAATCTPIHDTSEASLPILTAVCVSRWLCRTCARSGTVQQNSSSSAVGKR